MKPIRLSTIKAMAQDLQYCIFSSQRRAECLRGVQGSGMEGSNFSAPQEIRNRIFEYRGILNTEILHVFRPILGCCCILLKRFGLCSAPSS